MMKYFSVAILVLLAISATSAEEEAAEASDVLILSDDNFNEALADNEHIMVEFFAPWCGHCKRLAPEYAEAAKTLAGEESSIKMASFDCTQDKKSTCSAQGIKGFPTMKTFVKGKEFEKYQGGRTASNIVDYLKLVKDGKVQPKPEAPPASKGDNPGDKKLVQNLQDQVRALTKRVATLERASGIEPAPEPKREADPEEPVKDSKVLTLTDSTFEKGVESGLTLVEFYAPWCGHCKKLAPDYETAAKTLDGVDGVNLAKVDCTVEKEVAEKFGIRGYPTIKLFNNGEEVEEYRRPRSADSLADYMKDSLKKFPAKKDEGKDEL